MPKDKKLTIRVPKPKSRIPVAPPGQPHENERRTDKLRPSGRERKHKGQTDDSNRG